MTASPAIALDRVTLLYGAFAALRDVTLSIDAGSTIVLLGENGAGKSTLLRLIAGLAAPAHGAVTVFGERPHDVRHRVAYMSHASMLYDELTALENLRYFASLYFPAATLDPATALREVGLDPALSRRVSQYSQGMKQRVSLARALLSSPDLLLLDEPFSNLDAAGAQAMVDRLRAFAAAPAASPRTIILTTHQRELALPIATQVLTLARGRLLP